MADGIYVSMCGAVARTEQLESVADNLANLQTRGFKASHPAFESFIPAGGRYDKAFPSASGAVIDLRPGPISTTGNPLDVVPEDGAYLAVQGPAGLVNFTRNGTISLDETRRLVIGGRPVLARGGQQIMVPSGYVPEVLPNGTVRGVLSGKGDRNGRPEDMVLGELATFRLGGAVERTGPAMLRPGPGGGASELPETRLRIGEIELGNASPLETTVLMISAQRNYDASMQALQVYRSMSGAELGRTR